MSERDDYADNDLPPPQRWPQFEVVFSWAGNSIGVVVVLLLSLYEYLKR